MTTEEVIDNLNEVIGQFANEVSGYDVVFADEDTIPKVEGPFILVDLSSLEQIDWEDEVYEDENGVKAVVKNFTALYTLTAYRGKPSTALAKVLQGFGFPYLRNKYFPLGTPYAYSSASNITRMRIPLNQQYFENRARVLITFNLRFIESDYGAFEEVREIQVSTDIDDGTGAIVPIEGGSNMDDTPVPPDPDPEPHVPEYHDQIVEVCVKIPVIDRSDLISDKPGA